MSDREEQWHLPEDTLASRSPSGWSPEPNPVESFTSSIEHALRQLSLELAAIRAERDGLRLELEGLRAQHELVRQQLLDRERFDATVRELSEVIRTLNIPVSWIEPSASSTTAAPVAFVPLASASPAAPAPAPEPAAPVAPEPVVPVAPAPPAAAAIVSAETADTFSWANPEVKPAADVDWSSYLHGIRQAVTAPEAPAAPPEPAIVPPVVEPVAVAPPAPEVAPITVPPVAVPAAPEAPAPEAVAPPAAPVPPPAPEPAAPPVEQPVASTTEAAPTIAPAPEAPVAPPVVEAPVVEAPAPSPEPSVPFAQVDGRGAETKGLQAFQEGTWQIPSSVPERRRRFDPMVWGRRLLAAVGGLLLVMLLVVAVGPKVLPYQTFFVRTGSMVPTIGVGELIFLSRVDAADLEVGDIITFERPDKEGVMVTHRITALETTDDGQKVFQTKGDANGAADVWRVPATGEGWKYTFGLPKIGYVFGYLNTPQARLGLLAVPAVILGLLSMIDIWKPKSGSKQPARSRR